ncbi:hypothetical protein T4B_6727 [Trichinella pseudospiralis]|uniref:Uncharacterized protein n=1 Tax=Trichinella pseudospiralis TaxID=6337 RepID=A0A0V1GMG2_TRIPS|nr:hypothetical protein T4B_6727 [Trichinella pseudospiralis]
MDKAKTNVCAECIAFCPCITFNKYLDSSGTSQLENISSLPAPFSQEVVRLSVSTDCRPFLVQNAMSVDTSLKIDVCMPLHITVIPCYYQTLSHSLESWTSN